MKLVMFSLALCSPLHAELLATMQTTRGSITVALQYDKAPQAVANFITLAEGTRRHISHTTGAVTDAPYYVGEKFFRVINDAGFKIAQTGSGTGTNVGGPGYSFRDEFHPSLTHVPYVLSMANSGVNSNGSQIFFTGNVTIPSLNNVHTIFGLITDGPSRTVLDAILGAGNDNTTITGVTFSRTDPAALAFNEHAQNLPSCIAAPGALAVNLGVETVYNLVTPFAPGSIFQGFRSEDLVSWEKLGEIYQGTGQSASYTDVTFDAADLAKAFYNVSSVIYPDALAPASGLANRTLVAGLFGTETLTFVFDASGQGGTITYSGDSKVATITSTSYTANAPYRATWIIESNNYSPFRIIGVLKSSSVSQIIGTNTSEQSPAPGFWNPVSSGTLTVTR
jgi:peptidyl-prolyl cis-trans isomerase A (cyclophilin A)